MSAPVGNKVFSLAWLDGADRAEIDRLGRIARTHGNSHVREAARERHDLMFNRLFHAHQARLGALRMRPVAASDIARFPIRPIESLAPATRTRIERGIANFNAGRTPADGTSS
jgi:hypothetical protein